jgi:probable F420-dependent oxidoreductase
VTGGDPRPFRFCTGPGPIADRERLVRWAGRLEGLGYSTFAMPDHFMIPLSPLLALLAAAEATTTIRLTTLVLNQDLRHPAVLAKDLATLDVLSGGRLEIGVGAGWMRQEYEQAGIRFDSAGKRIERLEEYVTVLKALFGDGAVQYSGRHLRIDGLEGSPKPVQRPHPPIMIGGGGRKLLAVAGRQADIVQLVPPIAADGAASGSGYTGDSYAERIDWLRDAAGPRFDRIELGAQLMAVRITDDPTTAIEEFGRRLADRSPDAAPDAAALRSLVDDSPVVAIGTLDEVCAKFERTRQRFGLSYFTAPVGVRPETLAPVIERLGGR